MEGYQGTKKSTLATFGAFFDSAATFTCENIISVAFSPYDFMEIYVGTETKQDFFNGHIWGTETIKYDRRAFSSKHKNKKTVIMRK